jgi:phytoene dehydrogenase-like protein
MEGIRMPVGQTDALIVGGGHNGLVTAAYLAKAGLHTTVLERREVLGGCSVTEELWPGYRVSTAAYLTSLLQERVVADLELEHFGYHVEPKDPPFFSPFPAGRIAHARSRRSRSFPAAMPSGTPPTRNTSSALR